MSFRDETIRLPLCPLAAVRPRQPLIEYAPRPRPAIEHNGGTAEPHRESSAGSSLRERLPEHRDDFRRQRHTPVEVVSAGEDRRAAVGVRCEDSLQSRGATRGVLERPEQAEADGKPVQRAIIRPVQDLEVEVLPARNLARQIPRGRETVARGLPAANVMKRELRGASARSRQAEGTRAGLVPDAREVSGG
jgi:hypothetical protein